MLEPYRRTSNQGDVMDRLFRRLRPGRPAAATFCERCAEACTPACRADARLDGARTQAFRQLLIR